MGGGSDSKTEQIQTQQTISDSYNTTVDQVLNLADVGNLKINVPDGSTGGLPSWAPFAGVAILGVIAVMRFKK